TATNRDVRALLWLAQQLLPLEAAPGGPQVRSLYAHQTRSHRHLRRAGQLHPARRRKKERRLKIRLGQLGRTMEGRPSKSGKARQAYIRRTFEMHSASMPAIPHGLRSPLN